MRANLSRSPAMAMIENAAMTWPIDTTSFSFSCKCAWYKWRRPEGAMSTNSFTTRKFEDFTILGPSGTTVGHIRVKPSGILWAAKDSKVWYGLTLDKFAEFAQINGKKQKK